MVKLNSVEWRGRMCRGSLQEEAERKTEMGNAKFPGWQEMHKLEKELGIGVNGR